ncbi:uncharacterized protein SPAPADRAFT_139333 [Spathaspora passalidarum NRRL Y-27907]|uniref:Uncharacterized protein n=1 Tax=Spathaspora passalidarum (strain NRRL Y-27907 / 11-Y1) TaxID=619300 RepID=G3ANM7_SPAPN|nr:uncharacterized protein SPAPADRAFT_139333 [Spathaspora passalidarum NRRL Y-27907]EGW32556.1 hypothetical protein SPAPADRAFT_139333 [Spathaspora passalidarum NRRL Y-27907]
MHNYLGSGDSSKKGCNKNDADYLNYEQDQDEKERALTNLRSDIYSIGPKILPLPFSREFMNLKYTKFVPLAQCKLDPKYALRGGARTNYNTTKRFDIHQPTEPDDEAKLGLCRLKYESGSEFLCLDTETDVDAEKTKHKSRSRRSKKEMKEIEKLAEVRTDRYYSRLNIYELSKILELDGFHISLTKEIELKILELFGNYCDFRLGYQTWIRDTNRAKRNDLINQLYSYSSVFYPEIDKFKLEVIVRRGSYSLMQTRLRRERRMSKHINRSRYKSS